MLRMTLCTLLELWQGQLRAPLPLLLNDEVVLLFLSDGPPKAGIHQGLAPEVTQHHICQIPMVQVSCGASLDSRGGRLEPISLGENGKVITEKPSEMREFVVATGRDTTYENPNTVLPVTKISSHTTAKRVCTPPQTLGTASQVSHSLPSFRLACLSFLLFLMNG